MSTSIGKRFIFPLSLILALSLGACDKLGLGEEAPDEETGTSAGDTIETVDTDTISEEVDTTDLSAEDDQDREVQNELREGGTANEEVATSGSKQWRLVLSSMPSRERAERFREKISEPGSEIIYVDRLNTYRVVYRSFDDLREAQREYEQLSAQHPDAWLVYF